MRTKLSLLCLWPQLRRAGRRQRALLLLLLLLGVAEGQQLPQRAWPLHRRLQHAGARTDIEGYALTAVNACCCQRRPGARVPAHRSTVTGTSGDQCKDACTATKRHVACMPCFRARYSMQELATRHRLLSLLRRLHTGQQAREVVAAGVQQRRSMRCCHSVVRSLHRQEATQLQPQFLGRNPCKLSSLACGLVRNATLMTQAECCMDPERACMHAAIGGSCMPPVVLDCLSATQDT